MGFLVTLSNGPLVPDALPAIKVCRRYGGNAPVYTLARLYAQPGSLALSLYAFERAPHKESQIAFALGGAGAEYATVVLSPENAQLYYLPKAVPASLHFAAPAAETWRPAAFSGVDEQGWYWGAHLSLSEPVLQRVGIFPAEGALFSCALFQYSCATPSSFGSSVALTNKSAPLCFDDFSPCTMVAY